MGEVSRQDLDPVFQVDLLCKHSSLVDQRRFLYHRTPEMKARAASCLHREREVVERAEALEDAGDLVAARDTRLDAFMLSPPGDVRVLKQNLPVIGGKAARDLADQGG